jgi:hypothetical protein
MQLDADIRIGSLSTPRFDLPLVKVIGHVNAFVTCWGRLGLG